MGTNIEVTSEVFGGADKSWIGTRMGLQDMRSIMLDMSTFVAAHVVNGYIPSGIALGQITSSSKYGPYGGAANEVQSVDVDATGGDFTLSFEGQETAAIAWNATAAAVQTALEALPNINVGDVVCAGGPGATAPITITFSGQYSGQDVAALVSDATGLTGGAGTATVAEDTAGGSAVSDGREVLQGHLFEDCKVSTGVPSTATDVGAALFWTGVVKTSNLPAFAGTVAGEVDDAGKAAVASWIRYE